MPPGAKPPASTGLRWSPGVNKQAAAANRCIWSRAHWPPGPPWMWGDVSCLQEAVPVWKRIWDSQRSWIHLHFSVWAHCHSHSFSRSNSLRTPLTPAQPRATDSPFSNFLWSCPQKKDWALPGLPSALPGAVHSLSGWPVSRKEQSQSSGVFSAYWDKFNKQTNKSNNQLYREMFCFFILLTPSKGNICGLHNLRYFVHMHT